MLDDVLKQIAYLLAYAFVQLPITHQLINQGKMEWAFRIGNRKVKVGVEFADYVYKTVGEKNGPDSQPENKSARRPS